MPKDGKWKPYNVDYLERNVREVFRSGDIGKLTKETYHFITQHLGKDKLERFRKHSDKYSNVILVLHLSIPPCLKKAFIKNNARAQPL